MASPPAGPRGGTGPGRVHGGTAESPSPALRSRRLTGARAGSPGLQRGRRKQSQQDRPLRSCSGKHCSAPSLPVDRELQDQQHGGSLCQSHQVLPLPVQLALLYPGRRDPGLRGVDPGRQEQLYLCPADVLQLAQDGSLHLHRRGGGHHVHGLPGLPWRHQRGPLPPGAVLRLPPPDPHRPGDCGGPLLLQRGQAEAGDGWHRDRDHPELQRQRRGQPAGGLGLRAGSGAVLRLGQFLQLDRQRRAHESHRSHLPLLLRGQGGRGRRAAGGTGLLPGRRQQHPERQQPGGLARVPGGLHGEGAGVAAGEPGRHPWRVCGRRRHRAPGDAAVRVPVPAHPLRGLQQGPQVLRQLGHHLQAGTAPSGLPGALPGPLPQAPSPLTAKASPALAGGWGLPGTWSSPSASLLLAVAPAVLWSLFSLPARVLLAAQQRGPLQRPCAGGLDVHLLPGGGCHPGKGWGRVGKPPSHPTRGSGDCPLAKWSWLPLRHLYLWFFTLLLKGGAGVGLT